ncbi:MAG: rhamnulokinase [Spirochaetales bacterium]|nr:MAG: rhamnulokinase [Spirochaetales bacterium]
MKSSCDVLAADVGAGSGRLLHVKYDGSRLSFGQTHRFWNGTIKAGESLYWDVLGIYHNLAEGLAKTSLEGGCAVSMGIDTWGNDFALLDRKGLMIENPHTYRDPRTEGMIAYVSRMISEKDLYLRNGIQHVRMNTLYQLVSLVKERPYVFDNAEKFLFIPDLITYFLTGETRCEYTLATISQLYNYGMENWDLPLMKLLGIPERLFPPIIRPGERCGTILPSVCADLKIESIPLIAVGAHDTASAAAAVPEPDGQSIFISSGTWSIVGTETAAPVINDTSFRYNYANEGGSWNNIRLNKNVMGMWIVQECRRRFFVEGRSYSFGDLSSLAEAAGPFGSVIDPDDSRFYEPADMPAMIRDYCRETGQLVPDTDGGIIRCALESLALKYRYVIEILDRLIGRSLGSINVVGGGANNHFLCQLTADCCNRRVYAGPDEATALGNALTQLTALGELSGSREARMLVRQSFPPARFLPRSRERWDEFYNSFLKITGLT